MVVPFWIILPGLVLAGATSTITQYFNGVGKAEVPAKIAAATLIVQIIMAFISSPPMGLMGAALSFLCALTSASIIQVIAFLKISSCQGRRDLVFRKEDFSYCAIFSSRRFIAML